MVAEALGGSERAFARMMTVRARQIGMAHTTFRNASGLPARGQLTTARDMAIMARTVITKFPHHYHYFSTRSFYFRGRNYGNHNRLLGRYPGVDGLKTGFVRASGYNLIVSARSSAGKRIVAVVLGGRSHRHRDIRMTGLLNYSFGNKTRYAALVQRGRHVRTTRSRRKASVIASARHYSSASYSARTYRRAARYSTRRRGRWSIQVGAFRSYRKARRAQLYRRAPRPPLAPTRHAGRRSDTLPPLLSGPPTGPYQKPGLRGRVGRCARPSAAVRFAVRSVIAIGAVAGRVHRPDSTALSSLID